MKSCSIQVLILGCLAITVSPAATAQDGPGGVLYEVVQEESILRIYVGRGGLLAGFGHNHVVHTRVIDGLIRFAPEREDSTAELSFPVASLVVDEPAERERAGDGFNSQPSASAIARTRENMLGPAVLDGEQYPEVTIGVTTVEIYGDQWLFYLQLRLKGNEFTVAMPARVIAAGNRLEVAAEFTLDHDDLGLTPFRAMAGTLRVAEELRFQLDLVAARQ